MTGPLSLVIFDVDGTLVDSQDSICAAMEEAYAGEGLTPPKRAEILAIVGLSLEAAFETLAPDLPPDQRARLVENYKRSFMRRRTRTGAAASAPLFAHVRPVLEALHAVPETLLGVATGKSRRGLDKLIAAHGLEGVFVTRQVADHHPSKPHPSMIHAALSETGVAPARAVMVGDTAFDIEMATRAGIAAIGVAWGYHPPARLDGAAAIIEDMRDLPATLARLWES